tara:strand:+ start:160295 stop:160450 length:156 start_codon:yes stop_codon:yes gene_type:complete
MHILTYKIEVGKLGIFFLSANSKHYQTQSFVQFYKSNIEIIIFKCRRAVTN